MLVSYGVSGKPFSNNENKEGSTSEFSKDAIKDFNIGQLFAFTNLETLCSKKYQFAVARKTGTENCFWNVTKDFTKIDADKLPVVGFESSCIFACGDNGEKSVQSSVEKVAKYFDEGSKDNGNLQKQNYDLYAYYQPCKEFDEKKDKSAKDKDKNSQGNTDNENGMGKQGSSEDEKRGFNGVFYSFSSKTPCKKIGKLVTNDEYLELGQDSEKDRTKSSDNTEKEMGKEGKEKEMGSEKNEEKNEQNGKNQSNETNDRNKENEDKNEKNGKNQSNETNDGNKENENKNEKNSKNQSSETNDGKKENEDKNEIKGKNQSNETNDGNKENENKNEKNSKNQSSETNDGNKENEEKNEKNGKNQSSETNDGNKENGDGNQRPSEELNKRKENEEEKSDKAGSEKRGLAAIKETTKVDMEKVKKGIKFEESQENDEFVKEAIESYKKQHSSAKKGENGPNKRNRQENDRFAWKRFKTY